MKKGYKEILLYLIIMSGNTKTESEKKFEDFEEYEAKQAIKAKNYCIECADNITPDECEDYDNHCQFCYAENLLGMEIIHCEECQERDFRDSTQRVKSCDFYDSYFGIICEDCVKDYPDYGEEFSKILEEDEDGGCDEENHIWIKKIY